MGRKRVLTIPENAKIRCPNCNTVSLRKVPIDSSPQYFDCDKCGNHIKTPITSCCIICAFTNKKCVPTLLMQARAKNLEVKY